MRTAIRYTRSGYAEGHPLPIGPTLFDKAVGM
jgi:hypothetical protein